MTLIEVLLAVAIIGLSLAPLFILQDKVSFGVTKYSHHIDLLLRARQFFIESSQQVAKNTTLLVLEKKIKRPPAVLTYEMKPIADDSPLKKFKHLYIEQVSMAWDEGRRKRKDVLATFCFRPEVKTS